MQIILESAYWEKPDIAGNYFWPKYLLKSKAQTFGFVYTQFANTTLHSAEAKPSLGYTTFPTVEYANWAIESFNKESNNTKNWIPLKLRATTGIVTPLHYLNYLSDGVIPVAIDLGRTFAHDINYHYLSLIVLKPEINLSIQNRAKLGINFFKSAQLNHPKKRFVDYLALKLISIVSAYIDQTGNFIPFLSGLKADVIPTSDQIFYSKVIIKAIQSENDQVFFKTSAALVSLNVSKWSDFYWKKNLLSKAEIDAVEKNFPYDHTNQLYPVQVYAKAVLENLIDQYFANSPNVKLQLPDVKNAMEEVLKVLNLVAKGEPINQDQINAFKNLSVAD